MLAKIIVRVYKNNSHFRTPLLHSSFSTFRSHHSFKQKKSEDGMNRPFFARKFTTQKLDIGKGNHKKVEPTAKAEKQGKKQGRVKVDSEDEMDNFIQEAEMEHMGRAEPFLMKQALMVKEAISSLNSSKMKTKDKLQVWKVVYQNMKLILEGVKEERRKREMGIKRENNLNNGTFITFVNPLVYDSTGRFLTQLEDFMAENRKTIHDPSLIEIGGMRSLIRSQVLAQEMLERYSSAFIKGKSFFIRFITMYHSNNKQVINLLINQIYKSPNLESKHSTKDSILYWRETMSLMNHINSHVMILSNSEQLAIIRVAYQKILQTTPSHLNIFISTLQQASLNAPILEQEIRPTPILMAIRHHITHKLKRTIDCLYLLQTLEIVHSWTQHLTEEEHTKIAELTLEIYANIKSRFKIVSQEKYKISIQNILPEELEEYALEGEEIEQVKEEQERVIGEQGLRQGEQKDQELKQGESIGQGLRQGEQKDQELKQGESIGQGLRQGESIGQSERREQQKRGLDLAQEQEDEEEMGEDIRQGNTQMNIISRFRLLDANILLNSMLKLKQIDVEIYQVCENIFFKDLKLHSLRDIESFICIRNTLIKRMLNSINGLAIPSGSRSARLREIKLQHYEFVAKFLAASKPKQVKLSIGEIIRVLHLTQDILIKSRKLKKLIKEMLQENNPSQAELALAEVILQNY